MTLGREVDDIARPGKLVGIEYEHAPRLHLAPLAGGRIGLKICREGILELQGDTPTHHADAVDRVDQCLGLRFQDVSLNKLDHGVSHPKNTIPGQK